MPATIKFQLNEKKIRNIGTVDPELDFKAYFDPKSKTIKAYTNTNNLLKNIRKYLTEKITKDLINKLEKTRKKYEKINLIQERSMRKTQTELFDNKNKGIKRLFRIKGIKAENLGEILKLHRRGEIGSMIVYAREGCVGDWAYFPPGIYPKLSWFGWNDRISSLYNLGLWSFCYRHTWFRGGCLIVPPFAKYTKLGWWNNRISSLII